MDKHYTTIGLMYLVGWADGSTVITHWAPYNIPANMKPGSNVGRPIMLDKSSQYVFLKSGLRIPTAKHIFLTNDRKKLCNTKFALALG